MEHKPIATDAEHEAALREVETLMDAEFGMPEGGRLDILISLIQAYESKHFPLDLSDSVEG
ncbi:hypothetical protein ACVBEF_20175 [Glaciimonas sp. GG7]